MNDESSKRSLSWKSGDLGWMTALGGMVLVGLAAVILFSIQFSPTDRRNTALATGLLISGACLLLGGLVGFLFGIPRTLQESSESTSKAPKASGGLESERPTAGGQVQYKANTNLEQISDWLTKILVGVGLTQLTTLPKKLPELAAYLAPAFGGQAASGDLFAIAMVFYFLSAGFLFGYLWTRLFLAGALARADVQTFLRQVERKIGEQAEIDARALSLTYRYLNPQTDPREIPVDELKQAIREASPNVKVQIYYQAEEVRSETWSNERTKPLMERTIPIFEALKESDRAQRFHRNLGQLGFALKDMRQPRWGGAEEALSKAITIRGDWREAGWPIYEFVRALCRIKMDPALSEGRPSSTKDREQIVADLRVAAADSWVRQKLNDPTIREWMSINSVRMEDVEKEQKA